MKQTYLVTGASRGIGLQFVRVLSGRGDRVIAAVRSPSKAEDLRAIDGDVVIVGLDVSSERSIAELSAQLVGESVDVLINNAGVASRGTRTLAELALRELMDVLMINSAAPMLVTREVIGNLRAARRKLIVNISSQLGSIANNSGGSSYGYRASKTALNQLNRCLANELKPEGFTCIAMHPGWVRTDMGGAGADLTVEQSVASMLKVLDAVSSERNGAFLNYDGTPLPW